MSSNIIVKPLLIEQSARYRSFVCAAGYETRSRHIASALVPAANRRIALGFQNQKILARSENDLWFAANRYEIIDVDDEGFSSQITEIFADAVAHDGRLGI